MSDTTELMAAVAVMVQVCAEGLANQSPCVHMLVQPGDPTPPEWATLMKSDPEKGDEYHLPIADVLISMGELIKNCEAALLIEGLFVTGMVKH